MVRGENMENLPVIKQEQLDGEFVEAIKSIPGGEKITQCFQCGTCSGSCPSSHQMEYTPRKLMLMCIAGMKKEVLSSQALWKCASCYSCTVRCPRGIPVTDIIYLLKSMAIEEGYIQPKAPEPIFYQTFNRLVEKDGRTDEGKLMILFSLKTNPFQLLGMAPLGVKLFMKGRMPLSVPGMKDKEEYRRILSRLREGRR